MGITNIIGQEKLKRVITIFMVSDMLNSLLIVGAKGSGKSASVHESGKTFNKKIYTVPIGATPDMIYGFFSIEDFIGRNEKRLEKGILEKAENEILYLDEMNLFQPAILKELLDSVETKKLLIERDGLSKTINVNTKLIGTMNPEEGFLNPSSMEKIDLYVETESITDSELRKEIIKRNAFSQEIEQDSEEKLISAVNEAIQKLPSVKLERETIAFANEVYEKANCEGYRGLLNLIYCAKAICAIDGERKVGVGHITEAVEYTLKHRKNEVEEKMPPQNDMPDEDDDRQEDEQDEEDNSNDDKDDNTPKFNLPELNNDESDRNEKTDEDDEQEPILPNEIYAVKELTNFRNDRVKRKGIGKRTKVYSASKKGKVIGTKRKADIESDINIIETIKAGIMDGAYDREKRVVDIKKEHIRENRRKSRTGASIVFLVDASASMNANKRMVETKNAISSMLMDSYIKRDEIAMITFCGNEAQTVLNFTNSVVTAKRELDSLPVKGKTPLATGLYQALELIRIKLRKNKDALPIIVLISDGRANSGKVYYDNPVEDAKYVAELIYSENIKTVVIDTESGFIKLGLSKEIAEAMGAEYYKVEDIKAEKIASIVKDVTNYSISRVNITEGMMI